MWHRRDVAKVRETLVRGYTPDEIIDAMRLNSWKYRPFFKPGFDLTTPLRHAARWALTATTTGEAGTGEASPATQSAPPRIESDTGELDWLHADQKRGVIKLATPRLAANLTNDFCVLTLTALDDQPIASSRKMLFVATTGLAQNTGQQFAEDGKTVVEWGKGPLLIEPVTGTVTLRHLAKARYVTAIPLTPEGRPRSPALQADQSGEAWTLKLGEPPTTWWVIEVNR